MFPFYLILISSYILALLARVTKKNSGYSNLYFYAFVTIFMALFSGLRWGIGDTPDYVHLYGLIGPGYDSNGGYEEGFILLLRCLKSISDNPQLMIGFTGIVTTTLNLFVIRKYCKDAYVEIAVFIYIASGYFLTTMNGIRQSLAAAILFSGTVLIIKKKFIPYLILCILVMQIHSSAFVLIPCYFIVRTEAWSKRIYELIAIFMVGLLLYDPLMNLVFGVLGNTKFSEYKNFNEGGANVLRVLVFLVPVILSFIKREELKRKWKYSNIFINMSLLSSLVMGFSLYNWIFSRFTIYFMPYTFILLAYEIKNCFKDAERRLFYYGVIVCYFIFFIYEYQISLNMVYTTKINFKNFFYINR